MPQVAARRLTGRPSGSLKGFLLGAKTAQVVQMAGSDDIEFRLSSDCGQAINLPLRASEAENSAGIHVLVRGGWSHFWFLGDLRQDLRHFEISMAGTPPKGSFIVKRQGANRVPQRPIFPVIIAVLSQQLADVIDGSQNPWIVQFVMTK